MREKKEKSVEFVEIEVFVYEKKTSIVCVSVCPSFLELSQGD